MGKQNLAKRQRAVDRALLLFTKPARPGEVKTRLIGALSAAQAAELHAAFRDDLVDRLSGGEYRLTVSWALRADEPVPAEPPDGERQADGDLGERLYTALSTAGRSASRVGAVGSDHPLLTTAEVEEAFRRLDAGAEIVFGPATDGGYFLVAARSAALHRRLFEEIPWSSAEVLDQTLERCQELDLAVELLAEASDVDTPEDLRSLCEALGDSPVVSPRTRRLLRGWGLLGTLEEER